MRTIGIDLHKNMFTVCILEGEEQEFHEYNISAIEEFIKILKPEDAVAVESTGNSHYFTEQIRGKVSKIVVVNTSKFKVISSSVNKTDDHDAANLALYLQKELLPETRQRDNESSQLRSLAGTRDKLVKLRSVLKNKIHSILNYHGILTGKEEFSSQKSLERVLGYKLGEAASLELEVIIDEIKHLNENILKLENKITSLGKKIKGFENITSIKGIGALSGTILLSIIGNIEDFQDDKKLASFFGLVPKVQQSNKTIKMGRITKHGSKLGRTILVQCAQIAKMYSPYLKNFHSRICKRGGKGKAVVATARKLLSIIFNTLRNNWIFEDFPNFVLKQV
jgi:transposase